MEVLSKCIWVCIEGEVWPFQWAVDSKPCADLQVCHSRCFGTLYLSVNKRWSNLGIRYIERSIDSHINAVKQFQDSKNLDVCRMPAVEPDATEVNRREKTNSELLLLGSRKNSLNPTTMTFREQ